MSVAPGTISLRGVKKGFRAYHAHSTKTAMMRVIRRQPLFERRAVLRGVDLELKPGERLGLVGRNGAGKSTLFKLISGILYPDEGTLEVAGRVSPLIEVTAGLVPDMTGLENLRLNATLLGLSGAALEERLEKIVTFAGLTDFMDTPVRYYSSGMQARLGFSVAAHVDSDILLIDEVLSVGDVAFRAQCVERLREVADAGVTVIFVSHDFEAVADFCERVAWLEDGTIRDEGAAESVLERARQAIPGRS